MINPVILKEYDIRGTYGKTLFYSDAYSLGLAYGSILDKKSVVVARDGRHSSAKLFEELAKGFVEAGVDVFDIGLVPTPVLYYSVLSENSLSPNGVMITASHNPKDDNGFKLVMNGMPFFSDDLRGLNSVCVAKSQHHGKIINKSKKTVDNYASKIIKFNRGSECLKKVAIDCSGGAVAAIARLVFEQLDGVEPFFINDTIDPDFRAHDPDPSVDKNLEQLIKCVRDNKCDCGIAFDGDGDRLAVVDERGNIIKIEKLMTLFAKDVMQNGSGGKIIGDIKMADIFFDEVRTAGFEPIVCRTGHSYIKQMMRSTGSTFAAEVSGHSFFGDDYYGYDDAIYSAIRFIGIMSTSRKKASELACSIDDCYSSEIKLDIDHAKRGDIISKIDANYLDENVLEKQYIDGVKIVYSYGWILIRLSNTEDKLIIRTSSKSENDLATLNSKAQKILIKINLLSW